MTDTPALGWMVRARARTYHGRGLQEISGRAAQRIGLSLSVRTTQSLTRSARFSTGMSLRPCSYFIQHMALIFSRVTPPSFHQSAFLPDACAARASGEWTEPVVSGAATSSCLALSPAQA